MEVLGTETMGKDQGTVGQGKMMLVRERRAGQTCEAFDISLTGCIHVRSDPRGIGGNDRKELADEGNVLSGIH